MNLTRIIAVLALLSLVAIPALGQMTDYQKGIAEGLKIGFFMNQKYVDAQDGINVTGYNQEVERYNAWIRSIFGSDPQFLMAPLAEGSGDLSKPILVTNASNGPGIVHEIDGGTARGPAFTTNDMNLLSDNALKNLANNPDPVKREGAWLGGV